MTTDQKYIEKVDANTETDKVMAFIPQQAPRVRIEYAGENTRAEDSTIVYKSPHDLEIERLTNRNSYLHQELKYLKGKYYNLQTKTQIESNKLIHEIHSLQNKIEEIEQARDVTIKVPESWLKEDSTIEDDFP